MLARLLAGLMLLASVVTLAQAQVAAPAEPIIGSSATEFLPPVVDDKFEILVIGDAIASGLGDGLARKVELEPGFGVTNRVNEQSGIARPEVYDWKASLPKLLEGKSYDAVVVLLGANDRQMIRADVLRFAFNTPDWIVAYKAQIDGILETLAASIPKIYWVSVPPMADPAYDEAMRVVEKLQHARVEAKGATYVDIHPGLIDEAGKFIEQRITEAGKTVRLRNKDGVHFARNGNNLIADTVFAAIVKGGTAAPVATTTKAPAIPELKADLPMFGQLDSDGLATTFRPADLGAVALANAAGSGAIAAGLAALQSLSPPGSSAEKLFVAGESPPPPQGRVDDFSVAQ